MNAQDLMNYLHDLRDELKPTESLRDFKVGVVGEYTKEEGATLLGVRRISSGKGYLAIDVGLQSPPEVKKEDKPKIITPSQEVIVPNGKHKDKAIKETKDLVAKLNAMAASHDWHDTVAT